MIEVKTASLKELSLLINNENKKINDNFAKSTKALKKLSSKWQGITATKTMNAFEEIKKAEDIRYKILSNYSCLLLKTIAEDYEETEKNNISLADNFK